jgi:hypothetical protein
LQFQSGRGSRSAVYWRRTGYWPGGGKRGFTLHLLRSLSGISGPTIESGLLYFVEVSASVRRAFGENALAPEARLTVVYYPRWRLNERFCCRCKPSRLVDPRSGARAGFIGRRLRGIRLIELERQALAIDLDGLLVGTGRRELGRQAPILLRLQLDCERPPRCERKTSKRSRSAPACERDAGLATAK